MFVTAIEGASAYTRPIHLITRYYNSNDIMPGTGTLFFVNADGWALTCGHLAKALTFCEALPATTKPFRDALQADRGKQSANQYRRAVEKHFKVTADTIIEMLYRFVDCADTLTRVDFDLHPTLDIALLHFVGVKTMGCSAFPSFPKDTSSLKPGRFLCRLGYPFPEFTNFEYDALSDRISWTQTGRIATPRFPIEGMLTRFLGDDTSAVVGFELSTPGLRGQSGGPVLDSTGLVWGMQAATFHLDLDFDVDIQVRRQGHTKTVRESAVLNVGRCVHIDALKAFMTSRGVSFTEV